MNASPEPPALNDWDRLLFWLGSRGTPMRQETLVRACRSLVEHRTADADPDPAASAAPIGAWHPLLDPLYRLGHVERYGEEQFRAVPPTLLFYPGSALLYGARSPGLWRLLEDHFGERLCCQGADDGPAHWRIDTRRSDVAAVARKLGIRCQPESGAELLAGLPTLEQTIRELARRRGMPLRSDEPLIDWQRFEPSRQGESRGGGRVAWRPAAREPKPGLYRPVERRGQMWLALLPRPGRAGSEGLLRRLDLRTFEERGLLLWRELCRAGAVRLFYRPGELRVRHIPRMPLPLLVDRGLRLASGRQPDLIEHQGLSCRCYPSVGRRRTRQVARILGLHPEVIA